MTRYLLSVHSVAGEPREPKTEDAIRDMTARVYRLEDEMKAGGVLLLGGRLEGPRHARVVRPSRGRTHATDGPFAETKEQLGGFYVIEAPDFDAALEWASKVTLVIDAPIEVRAFADVSG
jgi:hypothetical protein